MTKWVEPSCIYFFKVDNRNTKKRCELFPKLTIKTQNNVNDVRVFIVNFQFISHIFLVFLLLTLKK